MKLIFRNIDNKSIKSKSFQKFDFYQDIINEISLNQNLAKAVLITANEKINSWELVEFKLSLEKINIKLVHIYSISRETVLTGKSLRINSTLIEIKALQNEGK